MEKLKACCDGGCYCIGNDTFTLHIPNNFGDCDHQILVFDSDKEFIEYCHKMFAYQYEHNQYYHPFDWKGAVAGKFDVYDYDCTPRKSLTSLDGDYSIYTRYAEYEDPVLVLVRKER